MNLTVPSRWIWTGNPHFPVNAGSSKVSSTYTVTCVGGTASAAEAGASASRAMAAAKSRRKKWLAAIRLFSFLEQVTSCPTTPASLALARRAGIGSHYLFSYLDDG